MGMEMDYESLSSYLQQQQHFRFQPGLLPDTSNTFPPVASNKMILSLLFHISLDLFEGHQWFSASVAGDELYALAV